MARHKDPKSLGARSGSPAELFQLGKTLVTVAIPHRNPGAAPPCLSRLTTVEGSQTNVSAHSRSLPDMVIIVCHGLGFGTAVPVFYQTSPEGIVFTGNRPFCYAENCSNGQPASESTSVKGTISGAAGTAKIAYSYEVLSACGGDLICVENGSFDGQQNGPSDDLLNADFLGQATWSLQCCPDVKWRGEQRA